MRSSSMTEEEKRKLAEKQAEELRLSNERVRNELLENERRMQRQRQSQGEENEVEKEEKQFKVQAQKPSNLSPLVEAYRQKFEGKEPQIINGALVFTFASEEEAKAFFSGRAKAPNCDEFLVTEFNKGFEGVNYFSCGDGHFYEGSLKEIYAALEKEIAKDANNQKARDGLETIASYMAELKVTETKKDTLGAEQVQNGDENETMIASKKR